MRAIFAVETGVVAYVLELWWKVKFLGRRVWRVKWLTVELKVGFAVGGRGAPCINGPHLEPSPRSMNTTDTALLKMYLRPPVLIEKSKLVRLTLEQIFQTLMDTSYRLKLVELVQDQDGICSRRFAYRSLTHCEQD
jgi:hypothetical protein